MTRITEAAAGAHRTRDLADSYIRDVAAHYGLSGDLLVDARSPLSPDLRLRFGTEKEMKGNAVVTYQQVYRGVDVWGAGLTVQLILKPLSVISSNSSIIHDIDAPPPAPNAPYLSERLSTSVLATLLALGEETPVLLHGSDLFVYRYRAAYRVTGSPEGAPEEVSFEAPPPTLPIPPPPETILDDSDHYVSEAHFSTHPGTDQEVAWTALIEVNTGAVLLLRPHLV